MLGTLVAALIMLLLMALPVAAYAPGLRLPLPQPRERFPTRREGIALLALVLLSALAGRMTGGLLGYYFGAYVAFFLLLWWGILLPPCIAGAAGRRPFLYGTVASSLYWATTVLFYRLGLTGREWTIPSDWLAQLSIFWPLLWVLGLLGCLPLYVCWRRQPAE